MVALGLGLVDYREGVVWLHTPSPLWSQTPATEILVLLLSLGRPRDTGDQAGYLVSSVVGYSIVSNPRLFVAKNLYFLTFEGLFKSQPHRKTRGIRSLNQRQFVFLVTYNYLENLTLEPPSVNEYVGLVIVIHQTRAN